MLLKATSAAALVLAVKAAETDKSPEAALYSS